MKNSVCWIEHEYDEDDNDLALLLCEGQRWPLKITEAEGREKISCLEKVVWSEKVYLYKQLVCCAEGSTVVSVIWCDPLGF